MQDSEPTPNPYLPVALPSVEPVAARRVRVMPMFCPPEASTCPYFSSEEFGQLFMPAMIEAFPTFGIEAVFAGEEAHSQPAMPEAFDAEVICTVLSISPMWMTPFQRWIKYCAPFLGYDYHPATFEVGCIIKAKGQVVKAATLRRRIKHRAFTERKDMEIALRGEAIHAVGVTADALGLTKAVEGGKSFWFTALWIPLMIGLASGIVTRVVCGVIHQIENKTKNWQVEFQLLSAALSLMTLVGVWFTITAMLPRWVYAHPSSVFAYRFASTRRAWVVRTMFAIVGGLALLPMIAVILVNLGLVTR